jgi:hypothetical protein
MSYYTLFIISYHEGNHFNKQFLYLSLSLSLYCTRSYFENMNAYRFTNWVINRKNLTCKIVTHVGTSK